MKVMLAHSRYRTSAPSGENLVVDQEAAALARAGHDVAVFEQRSDEIGTWSILRRAAIPARITRNGRVRAELRDVLHDWTPDILHVHNTFPLLSPSVLLAARDASVPVVATIHNYKLLCASGDFFRDGSVCHDCAGGRLFPGMRHGCYRGSRIATVPVSVGLASNRHLWREEVSAYVFISAAQRDLMAGLDLPGDRVFVKHNFVSEPEAAHATQRRHGISYVGRLDEAKGTPVLMRAWDLFRAEHPESSLSITIAGTGPLADQVRSWAAQDARIENRGLVPRAEARAIVAGGIAAVVPSAWEETFGLVAVEAMAAGVAPVVPAVGSFPELVQHDVDGILYRDDAHGLARAIARVDANPAHALRLGVRAGQTYRSRFHPTKNLDQLVEIYHFAMSQPRRPTLETLGVTA
jgi:glycosyltransferase involved in cell wall biosynthesis